MRRAGIGRARHGIALEVSFLLVKANCSLKGENSFLKAAFSIG
jgi:hypothetical protein